MTTIKAAPRLPFDYAPRFLNQQRRNAIPNRVSQLIDRADQFLVGAHMGERPFAERTSTNFLHNKRQQAWIERCVNRHRPEARIAPGAAFDRILFSDQDDIRAYFDK